MQTQSNWQISTPFVTKETQNDFIPSTTFVGTVLLCWRRRKIGSSRGVVHACKLVLTKLSWTSLKLKHHFRFTGTKCKPSSAPPNSDSATIPKKPLEQWTYLSPSMMATSSAKKSISSKVMFFSHRT